VGCANLLQLLLLFAELIFLFYGGLEVIMERAYGNAV
jgi:hypothetical protein